jgi:hypothetical protein
MDFHCDGKVNYSEFLAATISTINFNKEEKLWSAFKYFDTTDSGYITLDSVMDALKDSGVFIDEEGLIKTFNEFQTKGKGKKINFKEFKEIALGNDAIAKEEQDQEGEETTNDNNKMNLKFSHNKNENVVNYLETNELNGQYESNDIYFEKISSDNKEHTQNNILKEENNKSKANDMTQNNQHKLTVANKSNNKSGSKSKSNNKSSRSNKSNVDIIIKDDQDKNNRDKFTEVNENQN